MAVRHGRAMVRQCTHPASRGRRRSARFRGIRPDRTVRWATGSTQCPSGRLCRDQQRRRLHPRAPAADQMVRVSFEPNFQVVVDELLSATGGISGQRRLGAGGTVVRAEVAADACARPVQATTVRAWLTRLRAPLTMLIALIRSRCPRRAPASSPAGLCLASPAASARKPMATPFSPRPVFFTGPAPERVYSEIQVQGLHEVRRRPPPNSCTQVAMAVGGARSCWGLSSALRPVLGRVRVLPAVGHRQLLACQHWAR